jgi:hypothetical protein
MGEIRRPDYGSRQTILPKNNEPELQMQEISACCTWVSGRSALSEKERPFTFRKLTSRTSTLGPFQLWPTAFFSEIECVQQGVDLASG